MTIATDRPPTSKERSQCWKARDEYFSCLDNNNLWLQGLSPRDYKEILEIDPLKIKIEPESIETSKLYVCKDFKIAFDNACLGSWTSHFSMLRVKDLQKAGIKVKVENDSIKQQDDDFWNKVKS